MHVDPSASRVASEERQHLERLRPLAWAIDPRTTIPTFVSGELASRLALPRGRACTLEDLVHPVDLAAIEAACRAVAASGARRPVVYRAAAGAGRSVRFAAELRPSGRDAEGRVIEVGAVVVELGPEIAAPEALRAADHDALGASEERYRSLYNKTPVMMHSIDRQGRLVSVSDAWLRTLGYAREEVLGRPSVEFLTPASRRHALEVVLPSFFRTGVCTDVEYQVVKKNGEVIDVLLSAIAERDPDGSHRRSLAVLVDVTERNRAERERDRVMEEERALRGSAESAFALLDLLFRTAPVGLAFIDRELRYVRVNEWLAAIHGGSPAQSVGRTVAEAVPEIAPRIEPILRGVLETGEAATNREVTGVVPGRSGPRTFLVSYYPVRTSSGEMLGIGAVALDRTEEKHAATVLDALYREAQDAVRVRDDFLVVASHELRTPLTPLALYLQLMRARADAGAPVDPAMIDKCLRQLAKLTALVNDLLDTARIQTGRLVLHQAPVPFRHVVEDAVDAERVRSPHHALELENEGDELIVLGDERRLAQVVSNLVENAVKYSPAGSTIRVTVTRGEGEALLAVEDRGIGIPPEELPRLFSRFFRAWNAPVRQYGGLGLGLSICRDIVERHRGRIWAESELGVGSTFRVAIPLAGR